MCSISIHLANATLSVPAPVHLTNGNDRFEGRVEVYYDGRWGTVCSNFFNIFDAKY